ncbi:regulation of response to stimulus [Branchiostoma belcheri]|nr:regulation of response to stimulus [Branchiostoma belcheri]
MGSVRLALGADVSLRIVEMGLGQSNEAQIVAVVLSHVTVVASCGVVDSAFGAQARSPGFDSGSEHRGMSEHAHRQGLVSNGSWLQLADESSARRAGVVKAELERNQVTRQLAASIPTGTSMSPLIWCRWRRRMPKCVVENKDGSHLNINASASGHEEVMNVTCFINTWKTTYRHVFPSPVSSGPEDSACTEQKRKEENEGTLTTPSTRTTSSILNGTISDTNIPMTVQTGKETGLSRGLVVLVVIGIILVALAPACFLLRKQGCCSRGNHAAQAADPSAAGVAPLSRWMISGRAVSANTGATATAPVDNGAVSGQDINVYENDDDLEMPIDAVSGQHINVYENDVEVGVSSNNVVGSARHAYENDAEVLQDTHEYENDHEVAVSANHVAGSAMHAYDNDDEVAVSTNHVVGSARHAYENDDEVSVYENDGVVVGPISGKPMYENDGAMPGNPKTGQQANMYENNANPVPPFKVYENDGVGVGSTASLSGKPINVYENDDNKAAAAADSVDGEDTPDENGRSNFHATSSDHPSIYDNEATKAATTAPQSQTDYQNETGKSHAIYGNESEEVLSSDSLPIYGDESEQAVSNYQLIYGNESDQALSSQSIYGNENEQALSIDSQPIYGNESDQALSSQPIYGNENEQALSADSQPIYGNESEGAVSNCQLIYGNESDQALSSQPIYGNENEQALSADSQPIYGNESEGAVSNCQLIYGNESDQARSSQPIYGNENEEALSADSEPIYGNESEGAVSNCQLIYGNESDQARSSQPIYGNENEEALSADSEPIYGNESEGAVSNCQLIYGNGNEEALSGDSQPIYEADFPLSRVFELIAPYLTGPTSACRQSAEFLLNTWSSCVSSRTSHYGAYESHRAQLLDAACILCTKQQHGTLGTVQSASQRNSTCLPKHEHVAVRGFPFGVLSKLRPRHQAMEWLALVECGITDLEESALSVFPVLTLLNLDSNNLTHVKQKWFDGLPRLNTLTLAHNSISSMDSNSFQNLPRLGLKNSQYKVAMEHDSLTELAKPSVEPKRRCSYRELQLTAASQNYGLPLVILSFNTGKARHATKLTHFCTRAWEDVGSVRIALGADVSLRIVEIGLSQSNEAQIVAVVLSHVTPVENKDGTPLNINASASGHEEMRNVTCFINTWRTTYRHVFPSPVSSGPEDSVCTEQKRKEEKEGTLTTPSTRTTSSILNGTISDTNIPMTVQTGKETGLSRGLVVLVVIGIILVALAPACFLLRKQGCCSRGNHAAQAADPSAAGVAPLSRWMISGRAVSANTGATATAPVDNGAVSGQDINVYENDDDLEMPIDAVSGQHINVYENDVEVGVSSNNVVGSARHAYENDAEVLQDTHEYENDHEVAVSANHVAGSAMHAYDNDDEVAVSTNHVVGSARHAYENDDEVSVYENDGVGVGSTASLSGKPINVYENDDNKAAAAADSVDGEDTPDEYGRSNSHATSSDHPSIYDNEATKAATTAPQSQTVYQNETGKSHVIYGNESEEVLSSDSRPIYGNESEQAVSNCQLIYGNESDQAQSSQPIYGNENEQALSIDSQPIYGNESDQALSSQPIYGNENEQALSADSQPIYGNESEGAVSNCQLIYGNESDQARSSQPIYGNEIEEALSADSEPIYGNENEQALSSQPIYGHENEEAQSADSQLIYEGDEE